MNALGKAAAVVILVVSTIVVTIETKNAFPLLLLIALWLWSAPFRAFAVDPFREVLVNVLRSPRAHRWFFVVFGVHLTTPVVRATVVHTPPAQPAVPPPPAASLPGTRDGYRLPPLDLLARGDEPQVHTRANDDVIRTLSGVFQDHTINARCTGLVRGPTVTRYKVELAAGTTVQKLTARKADIELALGTEHVRVLTPIPGQSAIGVEVPNADRETVTLGDALRHLATSGPMPPLMVALGKDVDGRWVAVDLAKMPHLLIGGGTGSGKSGCLNSLVCSLVMRNSPDEVQLLLIDPKRVEMAAYRDLPHLVMPVVTDVKKAAPTLGWFVAEMDRRYAVMESAGVRNIEAYNTAVRAGKLGPEAEPWPYLVAIVDEMADLMMMAKDEVEDYVTRITQLGRAAGHHLVLATQRPEVKVVTGLIKSNMPARIAFAMQSATDSGTILGRAGAEKLVGAGDGLFMPQGATPLRFQCGWVDDDEIKDVADFCRSQRAPRSGPDIVDSPAPSRDELARDIGDDAELLVQAVELVVSSQFGSTSMLQRKLRVGFAKAGRLMDLMERLGIVGPSQGSKPREVQVAVDELAELVAELRDLCLAAK
jgi:S-DNA-T family DNA segregation ATPase FtsK/SpoIIIE